MKNGSRTYWLPFVISFVGHLSLFIVVVYSPDIAPKKAFMPAVIDVSMVTLKAASPAEKAAPETKTPEKAEISKPTEQKKKVSTPKAPPEPKPEPKVSTAKPKPEPAKRKTALKKKTFKPQKVVKRAIKKIEKDVAKSTADVKSKALERLRKQVKKDEASRAAAPASTSNAGAATARSQGGGKQGASGRRRAELIDMYRVEIAYRVQEQWAYSEQLAGNTSKVKASIVFKVLPSGEIVDIFYVDRSGNAFLDESAYKAIVKANPVDPHPKGIIEPYVMVGLNFTPEGVR
jgi:colicin import membrane protein